MEYWTGWLSQNTVSLSNFTNEGSVRFPCSSQHSLPLLNNHTCCQTSSAVQRCLEPGPSWGRAQTSSSSFPGRSGDMLKHLCSDPLCTNVGDLTSRTPAGKCGGRGAAGEKGASGMRLGENRGGVPAAPERDVTPWRRHGAAENPKVPAGVAGVLGTCGRGGARRRAGMGPGPPAGPWGRAAGTGGSGGDGGGPSCATWAPAQVGGSGRTPPYPYICTEPAIGRGTLSRCIFLRGGGAAGNCGP